MLYDYLDRLMRYVARPLARILIRLHVSPNSITLFGAILTFIVVAVMVFGDITLLRISSLFLIFVLILDYTDGEVARMSGKVTLLGAFLDTMSDRVRLAALIMAIAWRTYLVRSNPVFLLLGGWLAAFVLLLDIYFILKQRTETSGSLKTVSKNKKQLSLFYYLKSFFGFYFLGWIPHLLLISVFTFFGNYMYYLIIVLIYVSSFFVLSMLRTIVSKRI